ncbi:MAG: cell division protein ZapA [Acidobacteriota bacterium]
MAEGSVPVEILGQRYPIRSSLDAPYVHQLAAYVDEKMRSAAEATPEGDFLRLAVVVALNLADEVFRSRGLGEPEPQVAERLARIEALVDQVLRDARA